MMDQVQGLRYLQTQFVALLLCSVVLLEKSLAIHIERGQMRNYHHHKHQAFVNPMKSTKFSSRFIQYRKYSGVLLRNHKEEFLNSLSTTESLNNATKERSKLMQRLIDNKLNTPANIWEKEKEILPSSAACKSLTNPGLVETFNQVAEGDWKVIYAPHMTTIAGLFGGTFDVQYNLHASRIMESHAKFSFPIVGRGFLSVSGTYDSVDEYVSRVDFDRAWVKLLNSASDEIENHKDKELPYKSLSDVPDSPVKEFINAVGKTFFIEQFSVFPISFLDDNLIVFDFPLLGTRICALKQETQD